MPQFTKGTVFFWPFGSGAANDDVVYHFNLQQFPGANEVACGFDVRVAGRGIAAYAVSGISGVIPYTVLCRMAQDLPDFGLGQQPSHAA